MSQLEVKHIYSSDTNEKHKNIKLEFSKQFLIDFNLTATGETHCINHRNNKVPSESYFV